jgi:TPR repeat protein
VKEALRAGVRDYQSGDKVSAMRALEFAAGQGHLTAQWKLGRMYADGDGVPHDDLKAFEYFSKIADENADETPGTADGKIVATAFVALGRYFRAGIKGSYVKANPARSHEMFHYAATYFRDPDAQFGLGQLYLDGAGVQKDAKQSARWLKLAAEKGHARAQAQLGDLLVRGEGVPRQMAEGLMWLTIAKDNAGREGTTPAEEKWIAELHGRAFSAAGQSDRDAAAVYLKRHLDRQR